MAGIQAQWLVQSSGKNRNIFRIATLVLVFGQIGTCLCALADETPIYAWDDQPDPLDLVCSCVIFFLLNVYLRNHYYIKHPSPPKLLTGA